MEDKQNVANSEPQTPQTKELQLSDLNEATSANELPPTKSRKSYYFGCGKIHPSWLQVFADPKFYTFMLSLFVIVEGAVVSGLISNVLSTLERRYNFSSTLSGLLASSFDITVTLCVVFVSYFGGRGHKPKWLGVSCFIHGIGCLVFASPQFIFFNSEAAASSVSEESILLCQNDSNRTSEVECDSTNTLAFVIFIIRQVLIGIGATPIFTIGVTYLDELVFPKHVSLHLGIIYVLQTLGPAVGFGVGAIVLSIYIDPWVNTDLTQSDPGWLGAWWISFIIAGLLSIIISFPFMLYPRQQKNAEEIAKAREVEMAKKETSKEENLSFREVISQFARQLFHLLTNRIIIFNAISASTLAFSIIGLVTFAPKLVENQFYFTPSLASILVGVAAISSAGVGAFTGAVILYFMKNPDKKAKNTMLFMTIMGFLSLPFVLSFLIYCPTIEVVGVNSRVTTGINSLPCSSECNCNSSMFQPVCGADGFTYSSPCSAGCSFTETLNNSEIVFSGCECLLESLANSSYITQGADPGLQFSGNQTAVLGYCNRAGGCAIVGVFLVVMGCCILLQYMRIVPFVYVNVRCVSRRERHLSIGLVSFLTRLFGSIPGPLVIGAIFDSSCLLRFEREQQCGLEGNCLLYDNEALSHRILALLIVSLIFSALGSLGGWLMYPKTKAIDEANDDDTETKL